jgi:hypothetical protein
MEPQCAAVAFTGGSVVLTAQTPYEPEVLADYINDGPSSSSGGVR